MSGSGATGWSATCRTHLDRFRAFRHRERSSYGVTLDPTIVVVRGDEILDTFGMFESEVSKFLNDRDGSVEGP